MARCKTARAETCAVVMCGFSVVDANSNSVSAAESHLAASGRDGQDTAVKA